MNEEMNETLEKKEIITIKEIPSMFKNLHPAFPSLCIPRILINVDEIHIDENYIANMFYKLNIGLIHKVIIRSKINKEKECSYRVFIHFKKWYNNDNANMARERVLNGQEIKIIYEDQWFWKVSAFRELKR
jgi:hypothetical protein